MSDACSVAGVEPANTFQFWEWRCQRCGWAVWAAVLVAAAVGLLGSGPLSRQTLTSDNGSLSVEYDRWVQYHHPTSVVFRAAIHSPAKTPLELAVGGTWLNRIDIQDISPRPEHVVLSGREQLFLFRLEGKPTTPTIRFRIQFDEYGHSEATVRVNGDAPLQFQQFVYP